VNFENYILDLFSNMHIINRILNVHSIASIKTRTYFHFKKNETCKLNFLINVVQNGHTLNNVSSKHAKIRKILDKLITFSGVVNLDNLISNILKMYMFF